MTATTSKTHFEIFPYEKNPLQNIPPPCNQFPMEVAEVLKWSFLICSVPVAFNGVQTRVLVDAPGKIVKKWPRLCRARILWIQIFLDTEPPPPPPFLNTAPFCMPLSHAHHLQHLAAPLVHVHGPFRKQEWQE